MIYFDNAASSHPKPPAVRKAVIEQLRNNGANPGRGGHPLALAAGNTVYRTRELLAFDCGAAPETVLFTKNTTEALNLAICGLLHPGDHVLISDLEHNSVLRPLIAQSRDGITYTEVKTEADDDSTVRNFRNEIRKNTRMILCTGASNVTGQILPVRRLGELCREKGILMGVDAAQTAGPIRYDLKSDAIDFLCLPGHKGYLGPQGTGALILSEQIPLTPLMRGGTGTQSLGEEQPDTFPEGFESGTLNTPGIAGWYEGIRYLHRYRGLIREREEQLRRYFVREIRNIPGFRILGEGERFVSTVSVSHTALHSEKIAQDLARYGICVRGGFHCSLAAHRTLGTTENGAVRFSFGYRNTEREITECLKYLKKYRTI